MSNESVKEILTFDKRALQSVVALERQFVGSNPLFICLGQDATAEQDCSALACWQTTRETGSRMPLPPHSIAGMRSEA